MQYIGDFFEGTPSSWGLRGDPYLWQVLQDRFAQVPLPANEADLQVMLEEAFLDIVGVALSDCDMVRIGEFAHGGMSSGVISGPFWRDSGFPLILQRYAAYAT